MLIKFIHFFWENVSVWNEIVLFWKLLLLLDVIVAKTILPCEFYAHGKVVDSLKLVEPLKDLRFVARIDPKQVPLIAVRAHKVVRFKYLLDKVCT